MRFIPLVMLSLWTGLGQGAIHFEPANMDINASEALPLVISSMVVNDTDTTYGLQNVLKDCSCTTVSFSFPDHQEPVFPPESRVVCEIRYSPQFKPADDTVEVTLELSPSTTQPCYVAIRVRNAPLAYFSDNHVTLRPRNIDADAVTSIPLNLASAGVDIDELRTNDDMISATLRVDAVSSSSVILEIFAKKGSISRSNRREAVISAFVSDSASGRHSLVRLPVTVVAPENIQVRPDNIVIGNFQVGEDRLRSIQIFGGLISHGSYTAVTPSGRVRAILKVEQGVLDPNGTKAIMSIRALQKGEIIQEPLVFQANQVTLRLFITALIR